MDSRGIVRNSEAVWPNDMRLSGGQPTLRVIGGPGELDNARPVLKIRGRRPLVLWQSCRLCVEHYIYRAPPYTIAQRAAGDLVLETREGLVLIDHKCLGGTLTEALAAAASYGAQLQAYVDVLERATGRDVLGRWLHLPLQGVSVEVR